MGCAASSNAAPLHEQFETKSSPVVAAVPDSGAPPVQVDVRESSSTLDVSISQGFLHGGGNIQATTSEDAAIYKFIVDAQTREGLRVLTSFPKMEVPEMPTFGAVVAMAQGQSASLQMHSTSVVVLMPMPAGMTISTKCAYVPYSAIATVGYNNARIDHVQDGMMGCIAHEANHGFRCVGMRVVNASTAVGNGSYGGGLSSTVLAELVFQKIHAPLVTAAGPGLVQVTETFETLAVQSAVTVRTATAFGGMATDVPELLSTLNAYGAQGWELSGFLMTQSSGTMPMASIMNGGMQPGMSMGQPIQMPFQMFMSRVPMTATPVQYLVLRHHYRLNMVSMMMGAGRPQLLDDPKPLFEAYAAKGWLLKGALNLPPEMRPGQVDIRLPLLLVFMSNTAAIPWAVPVAEVVT